MKCWISFAFFFYGFLLFAQEKKPLDHDVYEEWEHIAETGISNDGQWVFYQAKPGRGDATLYLYRSDGKQQRVFHRGNNVAFTEDSKYLVFLVEPEFAALRQAKLQKKQEEEQPKKAFGIYDIQSDTFYQFPGVKNYKIAEKSAGWVAFQKEKHTGPEMDADTTGTEDKFPLPAKKKGAKTKSNPLVVMELATGNNFEFEQVTEYVFSKNGNSLAFAIPKGDSTNTPGVYVFDTQTNDTFQIAKGEAHYQKLAVSDKGDKTAFLSNSDTGEVKQRLFSLQLWTNKMENAQTVADTSVVSIKDEWTVNEEGELTFSENGERLFFYTKPIPMVVEEDSILADEKVRLDVWSWKDPYIQPHQLKELEKQKGKKYLAVYHIKKGKTVQLADEEMERVRLTKDKNETWAAGFTNRGYEQLISWKWPSYYNGYVVNLETGDRELVYEGVQDAPLLSPAAKYIYWFNPATQHWYLYDIKKGEQINITAGLPVNFYYEEIDQPREPWAHGRAGWTKDDEEILVYDEFDIWVIDAKKPDKDGNRWRLTNGRKQQLRYRYIDLDREVPFIKAGPFIYLKVFDKKDKSSGFARIEMNKNEKAVSLLHGDYAVSSFNKAKNSDRTFFTRGTFRNFPDIYSADLNFKEPVKISVLNPQQTNYLWGTSELVDWISTEGDSLSGLLYKPENFDSTQKYPMIVYYYEQLSDNLHRHYIPSPSRSVIIPSFYASRGYVVFMPDIKYKVGYPGESAENAIMSGVMHLVGKGFVDIDRMGLQGQSWGGYQTAYLVTQTNLFSAAMAGAPVSNMTSAYGGVRWGSGMSRMFQYEQTQSRIGATLWENPYLYIENSPVFKADKINTPLLIMHNDNDGAVPWEQGIELMLALRRLQRPAWMLVYNNEDHNLTKWPNRVDLSIRMQQFFDHYLKEAPMPKWMEEGVPATEKGKNLGYEYVED